MVTEVLFLVEDAPEGGYIARAFGHSIFTEADSWDDLVDAIRDAVQCHSDESDLPDLIRLDVGGSLGIQRRGLVEPPLTE